MSCCYYASPPENPLLMGKGAVVSFYNNWVVSQMMSQCIPCTFFCPHYQQSVSNRIAHKLLPVEDILKLLYLEKSDDIIAAYNAFKLDHDTIIASYQSDGIHSGYKCCICALVLAPTCICLPYCMTRENDKVFHKMRPKMLATVAHHSQALGNVGLAIKTAHIAAPTPDKPARFPCCFKKQKEIYAPYSAPAVVIYKKDTTPPRDIDEDLAAKYPKYSHFMWR